MKILPTLLLSLAGLLPLAAQELQELTDQTLQLSGEESLYFGFTAGDEIVFAVEEVNGRPLREVSIALYPEQVVFADYRRERVEKSLRVHTEGVYVFRLRHEGLGNRLCRVRIQRRPAPDRPDFNPAVRWVERLDTLYHNQTENLTTGFTERPVERTRKVVAAVDTLVEVLVSRTERVHSSTNLNGNTAVIAFDLPANTYLPQPGNPYEVTETTAWAYALATGEPGAAWYEDANKRAAARRIVTTLVDVGMVGTLYGALAVLAIEGVSLFNNPPDGDNVQFELRTAGQANATLLAEGNSVTAQGRFLAPRPGPYALSLTNDNLINAVNVDVNIIALRVRTTYADETYTEMTTVPIHERAIEREIKAIERVRVPVPWEEW